MSPTFQFDAYRCGLRLCSPGIRLRPYPRCAESTPTGAREKHQKQDSSTGECCAGRCDVSAVLTTRHLPSVPVRSCGLMLLQLATPSLHTDSAMKIKCRQTLDQKCRGVLSDWRTAAPNVRDPRGISRALSPESPTTPPGRARLTRGAWRQAGVDLSMMDELGAWDLVLGLTARDPDDRLSVYDALSTSPLLKPYLKLNKAKPKKKKGWFS